MASERNGDLVSLSDNINKLGNYWKGIQANRIAHLIGILPQSGNKKEYFSWRPSERQTLDTTEIHIPKCKKAAGNNSNRP
jgi:hypothetical protein